MSHSVIAGCECQTLLYSGFKCLLVCPWLSPAPCCVFYKCFSLLGTLFSGHLVSPFQIDSFSPFLLFWCADAVELHLVLLSVLPGFTETDELLGTGKRFRVIRSGEAGTTEVPAPKRLLIVIGSTSGNHFLPWDRMHNPFLICT